MDVKWLRTFVTAAHYENFRHTSEVLFLAQPTVTMHIKRLEEILGLLLFERCGRNVRLTQAARRFLPHAKRILESYEQGVHDLEGWRQGYEKKMVLAVSPLIAASILPHILRRFVEKHPHIEVVVNVMESKDIGESLASGSADFGLSRMQPVHSELMWQKLYDDPVIFIAPHDGGDFESSPPLDVERLLTEQIVLTYNHPEYWDDLLAELRRHHSRLRTMIVSQVTVTKRFIEEGLGISFLPRSTVGRELLEGRMLEVDTPHIRLPSASTYVMTKQETDEVAAFQTFLHEFYKKGQKGALQSP